jgi:outer membrane biosynthesis protein TonB
MFDSVGKNLDEDAAKRSAQSALIASVLVAAVASAVVCAGLWKVKQVVLDENTEPEIVEIQLEEEAPDIAAPPPPPPPPAASAPVEEEEEVVPNSDDMVEDVKKLDEEIDKAMKSDVTPPGEDGGSDGGEANGVTNGSVGGETNGDINGQFGGGPRVVHYSQVEVKKRVEPTYPAAARGLGLGEQRCKVTVDIDAEGVPTRVAIDGCPKVFHPETEQAIYKWRWYPFKSEGVKAAAQFTIMVKYRESS